MPVYKNLETKVQSHNKTRKKLEKTKSRNIKKIPLFSKNLYLKKNQKWKNLITIRNKMKKMTTQESPI